MDELISPVEIRHRDLLPESALDLSVERVMVK